MDYIANQWHEWEIPAFVHPVDRRCHDRVRVQHTTGDHPAEQTIELIIGNAHARFNPAQAKALRYALWLATGRPKTGSNSEPFLHYLTRVR